MSDKESSQNTTAPKTAPNGSEKKDSARAGPPRPSPVIVRDVLIPSLLQLASGAHHEVDGVTFRAYRDALVREAGVHDVLEQTLLEQVALAHLSAFQLQAKAGMTQTPEAAGIYATAAAKLMGEVRRTIVALKELRSPAPPANITIAATQQVNLSGKPDGEGAAAEEKQASRSEQGSSHASGANRLRSILGEGIGQWHARWDEGIFQAPQTIIADSAQALARRLWKEGGCAWWLAEALFRIGWLRLDSDRIRSADETGWRQPDPLGTSQLPARALLGDEVR